MGIESFSSHRVCQCCAIPLKAGVVTPFCNVCREWLLVGLAVELALVALRGAEHAS